MQSKDRVNDLPEDQLRLLSRYLLNIHSTGVAGDHREGFGGLVYDDSKVQLSVYF